MPEYLRNAECSNDAHGFFYSSSRGKHDHSISVMRIIIGVIPSYTRLSGTANSTTISEQAMHTQRAVLRELLFGVPLGTSYGHRRPITADITDY